MLVKMDEPGDNRARAEGAYVMWKYLRWTINAILIAATAGGMMAGSHWMWLGFAVGISLWIAAEPLSGEDLSEPRYGHPWILDLILYGYLVMLAGALVTLAWSAGTGDALRIGRLAEVVVGHDALAARSANTAFNYLGATLGVGLLLALFGVVIAHDLLHRMTSPVARFMGRWIFALTGGLTFAVEHIYGHHAAVGADEDPATARRGESFYYFLAVRTPKQALAAWRKEVDRLRKKRQTVVSHHNVILRAFVRVAVVAALLGTVGGWRAVGLFAVSCLWSKMLLEAVTYTGHYGLVRVPGQPVQPRHSWNSHKRLGCVATFNLPRHSHHHDHPSDPFYKLTVYPEGPIIRHGYLTMTLVAFVPPLFFRIMAPQLTGWDRTYATAEERELAREHNRQSGVAALVAAATTE